MLMYICFASSFVFLRKSNTTRLFFFSFSLFLLNPFFFSLIYSSIASARRFPLFLHSFPLLFIDTVPQRHHFHLFCWAHTISVPSTSEKKGKEEKKYREKQNQDSTDRRDSKKSPSSIFSSEAADGSVVSCWRDVNHSSCKFRHPPLSTGHLNPNVAMM